MRRAEIAESILIVVALASLWPLLAGYRPPWYTLWLLLMLAAMAWVAVRRLRRVRAAAEEAKRKRDEAERSGRPPWLQP
ncbi:MAG: hypothetical protein JSV79_10155 [Armatimonadota bacterium]|nr:MAG: hypothetical protein JSV79_10155 [Armatimonadota bacterium]